MPRAKRSQERINRFLDLRVARTANVAAQQLQAEVGSAREDYESQFAGLDARVTELENPPANP